MLNASQVKVSFNNDVVLSEDNKDAGKATNAKGESVDDITNGNLTQITFEAGAIADAKGNGNTKTVLTIQ